ncbi:LytTR family DNA-binding domain-containing protein [Candidatus Clostridium stratigraminis]|uniref:LytTR family DNA-binding domain-containing protein n=1 Tax=Candidatus Clostridium stratigraminis TaxID=3381661 RepID=A0ABW8T1K8_9CLOT
MLKITVNEGFSDTEVIINCFKTSEDVLKLVTLLQGLNKKLLGVKKGQTFLIDSQDVLFFDTVDKRNFIYTENDVFDTVLKLYEIEEQLSGIGFIRCSKSMIINIDKIKSLCPDFGGRMEVTMINGERLIVSRQYTKLLKERLGIK